MSLTDMLMQGFKQGEGWGQVFIIMASKIKWEEVGDSGSEGSDNEVTNDNSKGTPVPAKVWVKGLKEVEATKKPSDQVQHKYTSAYEYRQAAKLQQLEILSKLQSDVIYLYVFKINHKSFEPTMQDLECVEKKENDRGWELTLSKEAAYKLLSEGFPNKLLAKMQLSNRNFKKPPPPHKAKYRESESNTQDTGSNKQSSETVSVSHTEKSQATSKDFSETSSNVSNEKRQQWGNEDKEGRRDNANRVYYAKNSYKEKVFSEKPKYRLKEPIAHNKEDVTPKSEAKSEDERQEKQLQEKKKEMQESAKKQVESKRREKKETSTKTKKSQNPFDILDE